MSVTVKDTDMGWDKIMKELEKIARDDNTLTAGFIEGQGGDQVHTNTDLTNAELAAIHEFGSPQNNLPERPFMRQGTEKAKDKVNLAILKGSKELFAGREDGKGILEAVGEIYVEAIKAEITSGELQPTKDGRKPLYDTGELHRNITYKIGKDK